MDEGRLGATVVTISNGDRALAQVIRRTLAKSRDGAARAIETTNAHAPGDQTVAEASYLAYLCVLEGRGKAQGIIVYDSREALGHVELANRAEPMAGLACAFGDWSGSTWSSSRGRSATRTRRPRRHGAST
jgi:hypothetical protein